MPSDPTAKRPSVSAAKRSSAGAAKESTAKVATGATARVAKRAGAGSETAGRAGGATRTKSGLSAATADVPGGAAPASSPRLAVRKTFKLYIGGAFPRSESGRTYVVNAADGGFLANAALASRKDVRDAVVAARGAAGRWAAATAYNRGQILYRVAEMLEGRRDQFIAEVVAAEGGSAADATSQVDTAIDRWIWYAGWTDKIVSVYGNANPVSGPYFNLSAPEPTGVVGVVAPPSPALLGLVSVIAPAIAGGNTVVVLASEDRPLPSVTLAEVLATSDLPGGVVNILTGRVAETAPPLAAHMDVNAIDLTGVTDPALATALEVAAAENLKRVIRPAAGGRPVDWAAEPGHGRMTALLEIKTVWHPKGV